MKKNIFIVAGLLLSVGSVSCMGAGSIFANIVQFGSLETLNWFIKHGANVNGFDGHGNSPLAYAVCSDSFPKVQLLLKNGAKVDAVNEGGRTALMLAIMNGNFPIAHLLQEKSLIKNINSDVNIYGSNALDYAVCYGRLPIVAALLAASGIIVSSYNVNLAKAAADSNKTMESIYRLINSAYNAPNLTQWQSDNKQILQTLILQTLKNQ